LLLRRAGGVSHARGETGARARSSGPARTASWSWSMAGNSACEHHGRRIPKPRDDQMHEDQ
jgi:hypothetical protein